MPGDQSGAYPAGHKSEHYEGDTVEGAGAFKARSPTSADVDNPPAMVNVTEDEHKKSNPTLSVPDSGMKHAQSVTSVQALDPEEDVDAQIMCQNGGMDYESRFTETAIPMSLSVIAGSDLLRNPKFHKGTAYTQEERIAMRIDGLLPPKQMDMAHQAELIKHTFEAKSSDLERYIFLHSLADRNETLFYHFIMKNLKICMPIVYTPTVGAACQQFGHVFRRPRGLFLSIAHHKGRVFDVIRNWPERDVKVIVVTDGERILGLGDLGCNGMGIPIGKLILYSACAGIKPSQCLPIQLDVGTENKDLLNNEYYIGNAQNRVRGQEYDDFIEEFVQGVRKRFGPTCLIQWEDFGNQNAFRIMHKYQDRQLSFNDDIQGTASVAVGGIIASMKKLGQKMKDQQFLFLGAGEAGCGIAALLADAMVDQDGLTIEEARKRIFMVDSKGLITTKRENLAEHKAPFAHEPSDLVVPDQPFTGVIEKMKPSAIIGVSAMGGAFTEYIIKEMAKNHEQPIIAALSNPTSKAECTAAQAYEWTNGKCIFSSGSPFPDWEHPTHGKRIPGQGNNAYIFPGVGMGVVASGALRIHDDMFLKAAEALAECVTQEDLDVGLVYPPLEKIRQVSLAIAVRCAEYAYQTGVATKYPKPTNMKKHIKKLMYEPKYCTYFGY